MVLSLAFLAAMLASGWVGSVLHTRHLALRLARVANELRGRTGELRAVGEHSPVGIFRCSSESKDLWMNARCEALLGMKESEVVAHGWEHTAIPEDRERLVEAWNSAMWNATHLDIQFQCQHADGKRAWLRLRAGPVKRDHEVMLFAGTLEDVGADKDAGSDLAQHQEFLEAVLNSVPAAVFVKDNEHHFVLMNDGICGFLGRAREEIIGMTDFDIFPAEQARHFWEQDNQVRITGTPLSVEENFTTSDGMEHWVIKTKRLVSLPNGRQYIAGAVVDMTQRRNTQLEVIRAREFLDQLLDMLPNPIFVKDAEHKWYLANQAFCAVMGRTKEQLIGQVDPVYDAKSRQRELDDDAVIALGRTMVSEESEIDGKGVTRWVIKSKARVTLPNGKLAVTGVMTDITTQKEAEQGAERSRLFLDAVINNIPHMVYVEDTQHRLVMVNDAVAKAHGESREQIIGKTVAGFLPPEFVESAWQHGDRTLASGQPVTLEEVVPFREKRGWYSMTKTALTLPNGERFIVGVTIDITDRKKAEEEVRQAHQTLTEVIDSIPQPLFVKDRQHRLRLVNRAFCDIVGGGAGPVELIGKNDEELFGEEWAKHVYQQDDQAFACGHPVFFEEKGRTLDSSDRYVLKSKRAIRMEDGTQWLVGISTDITAAKRAQAEAEEARHFIKEVLNAIPQPVFVKDREHRFVMTNSAFREFVAEGQPESFFLGKTDRDVIAPGSAEVAFSQDDAAFACEGSLRFEQPYARSDGEHRILLKTKAKVVVGSKQYVVGVNTDITAARRAAEETERSRQFLASVIDAMPQDVYVKDEAGRWLIVNEAMCRTHEVPRERLIGHTAGELLAPEKARLIEEQDKEVMQGEGPKVYESRGLSEGRAEQWLMVTKYPVRMADGSRYLVGVDTDVTALKRALREVEHGRKFIEAMVNAIPSPIFVKDRNKRFVLTNRAASAHWGMAPDEQVGLCDDDLMSSEGAKRVQDEDEQVFLAGKEKFFEERRVLPTGEQRWWLKSKCPVELPDGSQYVVGLVMDVTAIKAAEEALLFSQLRLRVLNDVAGAMARNAGAGEVLRVAVESLARCLPDCRVTYATVTGNRYLEVVHCAGVRDLPNLQGASFDMSRWPKFRPILQDATMLISRNMMQDERYEELHSSFAQDAVKAVVNVPLKLLGEWVGLLSLGSRAERSWADHEVQTLSETAEYLCIALRQAVAEEERKRAEQGLRESETRVRLVHEISESITANLSLEETIGRTLSNLNAEFSDLRAAYGMVDTEGWVSILQCAQPRSMGTTLGESFDLKAIPANYAQLLARQLVARDDTLASLGDEVSSLFESAGSRSMLDVPIFDENKLVAILCTDCAVPRNWSAHEVETLKKVGDTLQVAVQSSRIRRERERAQAVLRIEETRFRALTSISSDWFWETDESYRCTLVSAGVERHTGRDPSYFIGKASWEIGEQTPLSDPGYVQYRATLHAHLPFQNYDVGFVILGDRRVFSSSGQPLFEETGQFVGYRGVTRDITHQVRIQDELREHRDNLQQLVEARTTEVLRAKEAAEQANLAKSEFLASMSHELRTPMHAILSFAQLGVDRTARGDAPLPKIQHYMERIHEAGQRLLKLLNDLLDLSKLEAGRMSYEFAHHPVKSVIQVVLSETEALAKQRGVILRFDYEDAQATAWCDADRLTQVIRNLISNALKFTPAGGSVTVAVASTVLAVGRRSGDEAVVPGIAIKVSDEGVGIPEGELELIFDKFVQSSKTKSGAGGTGLGLAISREIVEQHGGYIFASHNPAGGAVFTLAIRGVPLPGGESAAQHTAGSTREFQ